MAQIIEFGAAPDIDAMDAAALRDYLCLLYTSPSPRDRG